MKVRDVSERLKLLEKAGEFFRSRGEGDPLENPLFLKVMAHNGWFSPDQSAFAFREWARVLTPTAISGWASMYTFDPDREVKTVGIVMAGNIPMAGLHDLLAVLLTGHRARIKLSVQDNILIPELVKELEKDFPWVSEYVEVSEQIKGCDFYIATGSGNSARYFREFFGKYPNVIRGHRNSAAVISGTESKEELEKLGEDMFTYYGLGCRSVSKIFVPAGYDPDHFFQGIYRWGSVLDNKKYTSNFDYYRALYLLNRESILENGFLIYRKDEGYASPPAVIFWESYEREEELHRKLRRDKDLLQCVASEGGRIEGTRPFGKAQHPELWDYADDKDTVEALLRL